MLTTEDVDIRDSGSPSCPICGFFIESPGFSNPASLNRPDFERALRERNEPNQSWASDIILLVDESIHLCNTPLDSIPRSLLSKDRRLKAIPADHISGVYYRPRQCPEGTVIIALAGEHVNRQHYFYVPVHAVCYEVVNRFAAADVPAPSPWEGSFTTSKIWDAVRLRYEAARGKKPSDQTGDIPSPSNYGIPTEQDQWEQKKPEKYQDPAFIEGIVDHLVLAMRNYSNSAETSIVTASHGFKPLHPMLWDVDDQILRSKLTPSQRDMLQDLITNDAYCFEPGHPVEAVSPGLRNRGRIWRLLNEMKAGDVHPDSLGKGDPYYIHSETLSIDASKSEQAQWEQDHERQTPSPPSSPTLEEFGEDYVNVDHPVWGPSSMPPIARGGRRGGRGRAVGSSQSRFFNKCMGKRVQRSYGYWTMQELKGLKSQE